MRIKLLVAYDGAAYRGFARNDGVVTVAETLETMIADACGSPVTIVGAGRTDKGVHARGQVVSFDAPEHFDGALVQRSVLKRTAGSIVIRDVAVVDDDFDARFSARWRRYHYTVVNRPQPEVELRHLAWHVPEPLSMPAMRQASIPLVGSHDFAAFCRRPKRSDGTEASLVRRVLAAEWTEITSDPDGPILRFDICATAFCHQMVRFIVGTLVDVGRGRLDAGSMAAILASADRSRAGQLAPPHDLSLHEVGY